MSFTQEQVLHIAKLSRLHLEGDEVVRYAHDLDSIVGYVNVLDSVPSSSLEGLSGIPSSSLQPRADVESFQDGYSDELLSCSPHKIVHHQIAVDNIMK